MIENFVTVGSKTLSTTPEAVGLLAGRIKVLSGVVPRVAPIGCTGEADAIGGSRQDGNSHIRFDYNGAPSHRMRQCQPIRARR